MGARRVPLTAPTDHGVPLEDPRVLPRRAEEAPLAYKDVDIVWSTSRRRPASPARVARVRPIAVIK
jgi:RNA-splicing ligase RtcB